MAKYVGETIRISVSATDFDGGALVGADVDEMRASAYIPVAGVMTPVFEDQLMTWDAASSKWFYDWATTDAAAGTYRVKVEARTGSTRNWEYSRLQLKANPV